MGKMPCFAKYWATLIVNPSHNSTSRCQQPQDNFDAFESEKDKKRTPQYKGLLNLYF
jgi:hypothetical protein